MSTSNESLTKLLQQKLSYIDELEKKVDYEFLRQWKEETLMILDNLITADSKYYKNLEHLDYRSGVVTQDEDVNKIYDEERYFGDLKKARSSLNAIIFGLGNGLF